MPLSELVISEVCEGEMSEECSQNDVSRHQEAFSVHLSVLRGFEEATGVNV